MSDLVKRLRNDFALLSSVDWKDQNATALEAADRIEALEKEVAEAKENASEWSMQALAAGGQAWEAYEAQRAAEKARDEAHTQGRVDGLREAAEYLRSEHAYYLAHDGQLDMVPFEHVADTCRIMKVRIERLIDTPAPDPTPGERLITAAKEARAEMSKEWVAKLNRQQKRGDLHPYTCPGNHPDCEGQRNLIATPEGWYCACGRYWQAIIPTALIEEDE